MNSLYITLFFNIVVGIVQTFIKSWNQLLDPRVIEICRQPFEPRHDFFLHLIIVVELSGVWWKPHVSYPVPMESRNSSPSCAFTFCIDKSFDGTHLAFGGTLDRRYNLKHVSLKAGSTTVKRARLTGKGSSSMTVLP